MGGGSGASITLDLGDDGGNDSTALSEIATANDDYGVVTEPSADKMLIDFAKVPPYRKYDPDRPPSSLGPGGIADEFIGGPSLTWRDGNIGATNIDYQLDGLLIDAPAVAGENLRVQWTTGADGSATDWVAHTKVAFHATANYNIAGIMVLVAGSEGTPTDLQGCGRSAVFSTNRALYFVRWNSYTSWNSDTGSVANFLPSVGQDVWLRMRYVSSTKTLYGAASVNGLVYSPEVSRVLGAHPTTSIGVFVNANNGSTMDDAFFYYFRQRTDATGTTAPYPCGE